jgi:hypothetical protein
VRSSVSVEAISTSEPAPCRACISETETTDPAALGVQTSGFAPDQDPFALEPLLTVTSKAGACPAQISANSAHASAAAIPLPPRSLLNIDSLLPAALFIVPPF